MVGRSMPLSSRSSIDEREEREGDRNRIETCISCVHTGKN